jgi:hypothetical protein
VKPTGTEAIKKILEAVGRPVNFGYPAGEKDKKGILKDRSVLYSGTTSTGINYWDVVDLIEFPVEKEPYWIRIGYYREQKVKLNWAGKNTITEPVDIWKKLLVNAAREKVWFKNLLEEVQFELKAGQTES